MSLDCEKKCKDCGKLFSFSGNLCSLTKRKLCDDCRLSHRQRFPPLVKINVELGKEPICQRKCADCDSIIIIFTQKGKRKLYCSSCKTIRAKASNLRYLENYVENHYARK